jgi:Zn-dependent protease with chaperone function
MKVFYYSYLLIILLVTSAQAQVEVPINLVKKGFILESKTPFESIRVSFEDDLGEYFSHLLYTDSTMVFKNSNDKNEYTKLKNKYKQDIQKKAKAKAKGTALNDTSNNLTAFNISQFIDEREFLKPGIEVEITFDEYRYTQKNVLKQILVKTDFTNQTKIEGLFEKMDGNIAIVDGQAVALKEGTTLIGKGGFENKKFASFKDMMYGMEVEVRGKRQVNGIFLAESGNVKATQFSETDRKIASSYKNTMKMSANEEEIKIADTLTLKVLKNITIQTYITRIGNAVMPKYMQALPEGTPGKIDFNFYVINDNSFNACAYPDGTIHIYTGLLEKIDNDAQLAAIIGHEIGHVVYKHARQNYEKQKTQTMITELSFVASLTGVRGADAVFLATALGGPILLSKYNRDMEEQADRVGLTYTYDAGFDPREAGKIWQKLAFTEDTELPTGSILGALSSGGNKVINSIYGSHPEAAKRYRNLSILIAKNYQDTDLSKQAIGEEGFAKMKKVLKRVIKGLPEKEEVRAAVPPPATENKKTTVADSKKTPLNKNKTPSVKTALKKN